MAVLFGAMILEVRGNTPLPWQDHEALTYEIYWGVLVAAEGTFTAEKKEGLWSLELHLKSRGLVETTFPIRSVFSSRTESETWRSLGFSEDRSEGGDREKNSTAFDYKKKEGIFRDLLKNEATPLSFQANSMEDMISMLYAIRRHSWEKEPEWRFTMQDRRKTKYGVARLLGKERIQNGRGVETDALFIEAEELNQDGTPRKNGWLRLWITPDSLRLPVAARIKFKYGTFSIRLKDNSNP